MSRAADRDGYDPRRLPSPQPLVRRPSLSDASDSCRTPCHAHANTKPLLSVPAARDQLVDVQFTRSVTLRDEAVLLEVAASHGCLVASRPCASVPCDVGLAFKPHCHAAEFS